MNIKFLNMNFKNPVTTASGTFSFNETKKYYDPEILGAVTTKGVSLRPWVGNPLPRIAECYGGMINSVGLENMGVEKYIETELKHLKKRNIKVITNVVGHTNKEYLGVVERLNETKTDILEINISCPNLYRGGELFQANKSNVKKLISEIKRKSKKPISVKLSPNTSNISEIAKIVEAEGADAVSLINTLSAMRFDLKTKKPILKNRYGGMSGAAVKPVALAMVNKVYHAVKIPIIGMGGIMSGEDAYEFILAGADLVAVGTAALLDTNAPKSIIKRLDELIKKYGNPYKEREIK